MSRVQLITSTPNAEKSMAYIARVSNPKNQDNDDFTKLIGYCIKNEHWSVFEQACSNTLQCSFLMQYPINFVKSSLS